MDSVVAVHELSCSKAHGIFPDQESNPRPLHWQVSFFTTEPPGKPSIPLVSDQIFLSLQELAKHACGWLGNHSRPSIQWVSYKQTAKGKCEKNPFRFFDSKTSLDFIMWEGGLKVSVSTCLPIGKWFCLESCFHDGIVCYPLSALVSSSMKWEQRLASDFPWGKKNGGGEDEQEAISLKDKVSYSIFSFFCVRRERDETLFKMSTNWCRAI